MRSIVAFAALVAVQAFVAAAPARAEDARIGPAAIAVSVRDLAGNPVAGALVVAEGPAEREATTGSAGVVTLQALPVGTYSVRVTRAGYQPYGTQVALAAGSSLPTVLRLGLLTASFADVRDVVSNAAASVDDTASPYVAPALSATPEVAVVRSPADAGSGVSLDGTRPGESRVELDGIPMAGGSSAFAALRFRYATSLDDIEIAPGPVITTPAVRDAIGGIVNYRTAAIERPVAAALALGYDSAFGSFQHARYTQTFGRLGVLVDAVTGGGENRSQTVKARYALSPSTSLGYASYGSVSSASLSGVDVASVAPSYAADLRTALGNVAFSARAFGSSARTVGAFSGTTTPLEDARVRGVQLGLDVPAGENLWSLDFDRRTESASPGDGAPAVRGTFTTVTFRANLQLSRLTRLEVGDVYSGGTLLPKRNDPQIALALRPAERLTVRVSAGSAFATAPDEVLEAKQSAGPLAPETSFGYRVRADAVLGPEDRASVSAFDLRRFDTFSLLSDARAEGVEVGLDHAPLGDHRLGALASAGLIRSTAFGAPQPLLRALGTLAAASGEQLPDVPYATARLALSYRAGATQWRVGTTWLGANNALRPGGVALGDASLAFSFASLARVRVGVQNIFGVVVRDPSLSPLYRPREVMLLVGPSFGT